jgi:uncharacterized membrane protein
VSAAVQPTAEAGAATADVARRLESTISRLLVAGTYLAMALILVGVLLMLAAGIDPLAHGGVPPFDLASIPAEIAAGDPLGFLWLGLVAVLALPLGRVLVAGVGFLAARDLRLALVSLAVLLVVVGSIVAAIRLEG